MRIDRLERISEQNSIFLVGPNGAGKSRTLRALCEHLIQQPDGYSIAISNTPYTRLPGKSRHNYAHIGVNAATTNTLLRGLLIDALESESFGLISMREVLAYMKYAPILGVRFRRVFTKPRPPSFADNDDKLNPAVRRDIERLARNFELLVGLHVIDVENTSGFLTRHQDVVRTIQYQTQINRYLEGTGKAIRVSFSLFLPSEAEVELNQASSGELTLLTTAMFALSRRRDLRNIFIDEPENSLHPEWQIRFFDFMTSLIRREDVKFYFATHSAVLANGALSSDMPVRIIRCRKDEFDEIVFSKTDTDESVEQLLWEAFDTVTPANSYLSETISTLFWDVEEGRVTKSSALKLIEDYSKRSFSKHQQEFLKACQKLILDM